MQFNAHGGGYNLMTVSTEQIWVHEPELESNFDGWVLWVGWSVMSIIMISSRRYMNFWWFLG